MIVLPLLAGGATLVAALLLYGAWLRALPRSVCPRCAETTIAVRSPLTSPLARWVRRRWCTGCDWSGWGRNGPVLHPERGPVADGSGFRWGEERLGADLGFRWAPDPARGGRAVPAAANHPSGFRWRGAVGVRARSRALTR